MKVIVILIFLACLFSCNQNKKESKKLIVSAINLLVSYNTAHPVLHTKQDTDKRNTIYGKAKGLLNKAIKIDSKSPGPYILKIMLFRSIQQHDSALTIAKQMYKLWPRSPITNIYTGRTYEEIGDTISSKLYFNNALLFYNKLLGEKNKDAEIFKYINVETDRAILFIMLNQQQKGESILNKLYTKEKDTLKKASILKYIGKTKKEILAEDIWY